MPRETCFHPPSFLAQACNNLIDLDAEELISAACIVYAELIQKDVSHSDYLSSFPSSSKRPSPIAQAQSMAGVIQLQRHSLCYILCHQPTGIALHRLLTVGMHNSCFTKPTVLPENPALIPHSLHPSGYIGAPGWAPRGSGEHYWLNELKNESDRPMSVHPYL